MKLMRIKQMKKWQKRLCAFLVILLCLLLLGSAWIFSVNAYVCASVRDAILTVDEAGALSDVDCILVLGCLVRSDGAPSDMLSDRLQMGITLYELDVSLKLLMSGDHGSVDYDEVNVMKQVAIDAGVPSSDIFMDHAGFSTYESMRRARDVFGADKIVIVTQEYHLYRALYVADALGIEAYGVASDYRTYVGQWRRDVREVLARNKDFFSGIFQPLPTYLGDPISLDGDGDITND